MTSHTEFEVFLFQFLNRDKTIKDLEKWVYSNSELENRLSSDDYLTFISLDFDDKYTPAIAEKIISDLVNSNDYIIWKLRELMMSIIKRSENVYLPITTTYEMYCKGYRFLDKLGMNFGLDIASAGPKYEGWKTLDSYEQNNLIDSFYPEIIEHAKRVLSCLDLGKLKFTDNNFDDFIDGYPESERFISYPNYIDRRSIKEKKLMATRVLNLDKLHVRLVWKLFRIRLYSYNFDR